MGSRLSEETHLKPKPMVEIGGKPILWHIMKFYSSYGINDFVICLGYKGYVIKEYFSNYALHMSDVTLNLSNNQIKIHQNMSENWNVTLVDTGENTMTGGRLKRVKSYLGSEPFCLTYGDGLADVDVAKLIDFHKSHNKLATVTAVQPPARFGRLELSDNTVTRFREKQEGEHNWVNGGFFVLSPQVINTIDGDDSIWEKEPLEKLARDSQLAAFKHEGFWRPMDTLRDKIYLEDLWVNNRAPWKKW